MHWRRRSSAIAPRPALAPALRRRTLAGDALGEFGTSNVSGAAFEGVLVTDLPDGGNIACWLWLAGCATKRPATCPWLRASLILRRTRSGWLAFSRLTLLGMGAFLVTNLLLDAAVKAAQDADRPELVNSDGDLLEFTTLHFPLLPGVTAPKLRAALAAILALRQGSAGFWNWLAEPGTRSQTVPRRATGQIAIPTMNDGSLVLRTLERKRAPSVTYRQFAGARRARPGLARAGAGGP